MKANARLVHAWCACGAVILGALSGCTSFGSSGPIVQHVSRPLTTPPNEPLPPPVSGLYTYVLATNGETVSPAGARAREVLEALLIETQGVVAEPGTQPKGVPTGSLNQFLIPAKTPLKSDRVSADEYDVSLSEQYLGAFRAALTDNADLRNRLGKRGPFLVASRRPIGQIVTMTPDSVTYRVSQEPILVFDLTSYYGQSVPEAMRAYKRAVANAPQTTGLIPFMFGDFKNALIAAGRGIDEVVAAQSKFVAATALQSQ